MSVDQLIESLPILMDEWADQVNFIISGRACMDVVSYEASRGDVVDDNDPNERTRLIVLATTGPLEVQRYFVQKIVGPRIGQPLYSAKIPKFQAISSIWRVTDIKENLKNLAKAS